MFTAIKKTETNDLFEKYQALVAPLMEVEKVKKA